MSQHPRTLPQCPVARAMAVVGGRWRLIILHFLRQQPLRFNELERLIGCVSPKMLTVSLDELEADGLISRCVSSQKPLKVEYALTDTGRLTIPLLDALLTFGLNYQPQSVPDSSPLPSQPTP